ncbi:hypothetical protein VKT23_018168 [Stygiomarasmius scandens]|uniref:F-box domain-containing protein n=1 Tax=Marasmiellus scandens TaxID=2682957 RepID=A0ABR1IT15_9AGAR
MAAQSRMCSSPWGSLPFELLIEIVSLCSAADRCSLKRTSHLWKDVVERWEQVSYSIEAFLGTWFPDPVALKEFRRVQKRTHFVISGSSALRFLCCQQFTPSDLDIYVNVDTFREVLDFVHRQSYRFVPTANQAPSIWNATDAVQTTQDATSPPGMSSYYSTPVSSVFKFVNGDLAIDVVVCFCVAQAILTFHSSVVMNMITYSHAICMFPWLTLVERTNVVNHNASSCGRDASLGKYKSRGWSTTPHVPVRRAMLPTDECGPNTRIIGDTKCMVVDIRSRVTGRTATCETRHFIEYQKHSFRISHTNNGVAAVFFDVIRCGETTLAVDPGLRRYKSRFITSDGEVSIRALMRLPRVSNNMIPNEVEALRMRILTTIREPKNNWDPNPLIASAIVSLMPVAYRVFGFRSKFTYSTLHRNGELWASVLINPENQVPDTHHPISAMFMDEHWGRLMSRNKILVVFGPSVNTSTSAM